MRPTVRREAQRVLRRLSADERESLIIKCWMSHDAHWFMAAALTFGLEAAQRLNQTAVRETGRAEARRLARRLGLPPVRTAGDYVLVQETIIGLLGPDLLDYSIVERAEDTFEIGIQRCFAFDNVTRAGIDKQYECGIMPRLMGWLDELAPGYELSPRPGLCLKAQGGECSYAVRIKAGGGV